MIAFNKLNRFRISFYNFLYTLKILNRKTIFFSLTNNYELLISVLLSSIKFYWVLLSSINLY